MQLAGMYCRSFISTRKRPPLAVVYSSKFSSKTSPRQWGMTKLQLRLKDDVLRPYFEGLFPHDDPKNTRFSINYFTSIGMGAVTEDMREYLQNMPKLALPAPPPAAEDSDSDSGSSVSSYSSYTGSSYSRSRSLSQSRAAGRRRSPSPGVTTQWERKGSSTRSK